MIVEKICHELMIKQAATAPAAPTPTVKAPLPSERPSVGGYKPAISVPGSAGGAFVAGMDKLKPVGKTIAWPFSAALGGLALLQALGFLALKR